MTYVQCKENTVNKSVGCINCSGSSCQYHFATSRNGNFRFSLSDWNVLYDSDQGEFSLCHSFVNSIGVYPKSVGRGTREEIYAGQCAFLDCSTHLKISSRSVLNIHILRNRNQNNRDGQVCDATRQWLYGSLCG